MDTVPGSSLLVCFGGLTVIESPWTGMLWLGIPRRDSSVAFNVNVLVHVALFLTAYSAQPVHHAVPELDATLEVCQLRVDSRGFLPD